MLEEEEVVAPIYLFENLLNHGIIHFIARVAKLADALALGASEATHEGSSPFSPTKTKDL